MVVGIVSAGEGSAPLTIDVISDVVCPWCYIGKRRLERAVSEADLPLAIRWRPYQLDPTIPAGGKDRKQYLEEKFRDPQRIRQMHEALAAAGEAEGITFEFERIAVSPNTLDAHRLVRWAEDRGCQDAIVEALFRAYFVDGRDIGDCGVLADLAVECGFDRDLLAARLASDEDRAAVRAEIDQAQRIGVSGVPTFILAGRYGLVGARPPGEIARALRLVADESNKPQTALA